MFIVGERCNILNPLVYRAVREQEEEALKQLVEQQLEAGADALEVNLGVCRQASEEWLPWTISVIRSVTDAPLFLTASAEALAPGLKAAGSTTWINGATADQRRLEAMLAAAECFQAGLVVLLVKEGFLPASVDEMAFTAEEVLETAEKRGFPLERLMIDPILRPRADLNASMLSGAMPDMSLFMDAIGLIGMLRTEEVKTISGLSNISLGLSGKLRGQLHCRVLELLAAAGLHAAIVNTRDEELMALAARLKVQEETAPTSRQGHHEINQMKGCFLPPGLRYNSVHERS